MKVVLAEKVSSATLAVFQRQPGWAVLTQDQIPDLPAALADADALVVRSAVQVNEALLAHAPRLRVVGRAGVGVDNIDAAAATRRGIVVMNTPGANAIAVAELTLALMLALARELPRANAALHAGRWEKKSLAGTELRGKTLGVLGLGRIGLEVARRARAFNMQLLGHDPFVSPSLAREHEVRLVSLDELFAQSDYLSLHVGLTPQTHHVVNTRSLGMMKPQARIINCARGELVDDQALAAALAKGALAGAALDVFEQEPLKDSPFFGMPQVLLTPHIAGSTTEAQEAVGIQIAEQVVAYLQLGVIQNAVNTPSLTYEQYQDLAPFAAAAERLGSLLAQLLPSEGGGLEGVTLGYTGSLVEGQGVDQGVGQGLGQSTGRLELVRNAALAGVLGTSDGANRINAAQLAAERGMRVHEDSSAQGGATVRVTLELRSGTSLSAVAGVASGSGKPRLLELESIAIESPLEGTLLVVHNQDVPGVIGRLGTVVGEHGINIASFALGRSGGRMEGDGRSTDVGTALAVLQIDGVASAELLGDLRAVEAVHAVRAVTLATAHAPLQ
jgi:D-3-phosphoglycerate dehydrogenase